MPQRSVKEKITLIFALCLRSVALRIKALKGKPDQFQKSKHSCNLCSRNTQCIECSPTSTILFYILSYNVVRSDGMVKFLVGTNSLFSMIHSYFAGWSIFTGGSRTAATSKVEFFVIIVNDVQSLTIITKSSTLDVAAVLDPPLILQLFKTFEVKCRK